MRTLLYKISVDDKYRAPCDDRERRGDTRRDCAKAELTYSFLVFLLSLFCAGARGASHRLPRAIYLESCLSSDLAAWNNTTLLLPSGLFSIRLSNKVQHFLSLFLSVCDSTPLMLSEENSIKITFLEISLRS